ncbi:MAG: magnesium transporter CorA family protein [Candidatus Hydrogenedentota bacterium]
MLRKYLILGDKIVEAPDGDAKILVFVNPDEAERKYLLDEFELDEHTLNSALDPDELSRLEFEPEHIAIIYKKPKNYSSSDKFLFKVYSVGLFLFKEHLIVILPDNTLLFDGKLFNRITSLQDLLLRLIYRSIHHYLEHLKVINMVSDSLEKKLIHAMENKYLLNLFTLEKSLVYYLNSINSNSMLIEKIRHNATKIVLTQENLELLDDIAIENSQCYKQAEIYSNILAGLMDARASIVNNNLNILMKTLNIITISIMVPTLVVSIFSMNVPLPISQERLSSFWIIMLIALLAMVWFMLFWKRKRW